MAILTSALETARKDGILGTLPVMTATKILKGAAVYTKQSGANAGYAFTPDGVVNTLAFGDRFEGIATETVDNTAVGNPTGYGTNGSLNVNVMKSGSFLLPCTDTLTAAKTGMSVFQDNNGKDGTTTITPAFAYLGCKIGVLDEFVSAGSAYVRIDSAVGNTVAPGGLPSDKILRATYDFAVHGGAVGSISLPLTVPSGVIVSDGMLDVITAPTSGGSATVAVQLNAADDIVAAAAISGAPWSTTGLKNIVPVGTAATAVKTTASRTLTAVVGTAALTAGKFDVYLRVL
jgi:hypothetical protein